MTQTSSLVNVHKKGLFGDYENKDAKDLLKISEITNLLIVQIAQYKNSSISIDQFKIDNLKFNNNALHVTFNDSTRILWNGPRNWFLVSSKKKLIKDILETFDEKNFAITDLSHSRTIIELEGIETKEVLKKGCPFNFNELNKNNCLNSAFNGINITVDFLDDNPQKAQIFTLRSFGESLHHSITDACLEFGYKGI